MEQVFAVALEAIEKRYYHWDIRPANLLCEKVNEEEVHFYILDWDSLAKVGEARQKFSSAAKALKSATSKVLYTVKAELSLLEQLMYQCVFKWENTDIDSKEISEKLLLFFQRNPFFRCKILNSQSNQSDVRQKHFMHLMSVWLGLV